MRGIVISFLLLFSLSAQGQFVIDSYRFGAAAGLLLDDYPTASAAYSLRLLRTAYTGDAIMVRRSSNNDSLAIGFSGGVLDTAAMKTFCNSTNCFVRVWYDQSGNGNDLRQTTNANQPKIQDSIAGVLRENLQVRMDFDGTNDFFQRSFTIGSTLTRFIVFRDDGPQNNTKILFDDGATFDRAYLNSTTVNTIRIITGNTSLVFSGSVPNNTQYLTYNLFAGASSAININGATPTTGTLNSVTYSGITIGMRQNTGFNANMRLQEVILYPSNQSSNRAAIETNINNFYSIY